MIREKIRKKILNKSTTRFLLPVEQAETYYEYLESRYGNQLNPFKRLSMEIHWDSWKFWMPSSDSQIKLSMNQSHRLRCFRQYIAYLNALKIFVSKR